MARFATVDGTDKVIAFTSTQMTYSPSKGDATRPAPWRSLPCPAIAQPAFDPTTEIVTGPTYVVNPTDVAEVWIKRVLTPQELSDLKDDELSSIEIVAATALFNHENRIRVLEGKPTITKTQFISGLKALL